MTSVVSGQPDKIDLSRPDAALWFNQEAKHQRSWSYNQRATLLLWVHNAAFRSLEGVVGDVLITGRVGEDDKLTNAPDELVKLLMEVRTFKVEVQTEEDGPWDGNDMWFSDWVSAYVWGLRLAERWLKVWSVRIVEAVDPPKA